MVGWMRYHKESGKNTPEFKEQCKTALLQYGVLPVSEKPGFVEKWAQTKASKNLNWVKDYSETVKKSKHANKQYNQKHMTRSHLSFFAIHIICIALSSSS